MTTRVFTTSQVESKVFIASSAEVYTTFSLAMEIDGKKTAGPRQFMIKTSELEEFTALVNSADAAWKRAKNIEKLENQPN